MQFTFLDMAGKVVCLREDAEQALWTVEELSLDLDFPYLPGKKIATGQRVHFKDPATNQDQIFEVKTPKTTYDGGQQVHCEHICVSELNDEHIEAKEFKDKTCSSVLHSVLDGTLWEVGKVPVNPRSSVDIQRGSVWQAVLDITTNYNVYIEPRVTLSATGEITRKLDIVDTKGAWNGIRLSVNKNMLDPCVTYDDTDVATALFGYGGTTPATKDKDGEEVTFADVTWKKTSEHPAKPKGQKFLEDPAATKAFGRNGRPRYGYYVNTNILDPETLLQKTWETLQTKSSPAISVEGTVVDIRRIGYADQPIKLHDIALVDIEPFGFTKQLQIIRLTVDLLDPSQTVPTIGAYIPNIVYFNVSTNNAATGGRGGGGGRNSPETPKAEFEAQILSINEGTGLRLTAFQRDLEHLDEDTKLLESNLDVVAGKISAEVIDRREADKELKSALNITSGQVEQIVTSVGTDGKVTAASILTSINNGHGSIVLDAEAIDMNGVVTALKTFNIEAGNITGDIITGQSIVSEGAVSGETGDFPILTVDDVFEFDSHYGEWKTAKYTTYVLSATHNFVYGNSYVSGQIITGSVEHTIHYLGY